ncbi:chaperonin [Myxococcaceae bacterium GXIMD 01537]
MAKAQRRGQKVVRKVARKVAGKRRTAPRVAREARRVQVTLGDLIAAAFDTVGSEVRKVARVVSSPAMTLATGKRVVVVG